VLVSGSAEAGPNFNFEFVPFRLTLDLWNEHTLGTRQRVTLLRSKEDGLLHWRVRFDSRSNTEFETIVGSSPFFVPEACNAVDGRVTSTEALDRVHLGIPMPIPFSKFPEQFHSDNPGLWSRYRTVVPEFVAYVTKDKPRPFQPKRTPAECEALRDQCVETEEERWTMYRMAEVSLAISRSDAPETMPLCREVDAAVARCLDRITQIEARDRERNVAFEAERRCIALVVPARSADGGVELRVVGGDGVEWEPIRIDPPSRARRVWRAGALVLAPFTAIADIFLMAFDTLFWLVVGIGYVIFG
jgi:hypothetical protein